MKLAKEDTFIRTGMFSQKAFQFFNAFRFCLRHGIEDSLKAKTIDSDFFHTVFSKDDLRYKYWSWWAMSEVQRFRVEKTDENEVILIWPNDFVATLKDVNLDQAVSYQEKLLHVLTAVAMKAHRLFPYVKMNNSTKENGEVGYAMIMGLGFHRSFHDTLKSKYDMTDAQISSIFGTPNDIFKTTIIAEQHKMIEDAKERQRNERDELSRKFGAKHSKIAVKYRSLIEAAAKTGDQMQIHNLEQESCKMQYEVMLESKAAEAELKLKHKAENEELRKKLNELKVS